MNKIKLNLDSGIELANCIMKATGVMLYVDESVSIEGVLKEIADNKCPCVGSCLLQFPEDYPIKHIVTAACPCIYNISQDAGVSEFADYYCCGMKNLQFYRDIQTNITNGDHLINALYEYSISKDVNTALCILTGNNL